MGDENIRGEIIRGPIPDAEDCAGCPLAIDGKPDGPVRGIGPQHPKFIIIAEGPGVNEKRQGLPLLGKGGQILGKALMSSNVKREEVWLGQTTLCLPPRETKDDVIRQAANHCRKRLIKEIDTLGPDPPILAVGKHAASALIQKDFKITDLAGTFHTISLEDIPFTKDVIPTIHPAAMLRSNDNSGAHTSDLLFWFLQYDTAKINGLAAGKAQPFSDDVDFETTNSTRAHQLVADILKESLSNGWLACDLETRGITSGTCTKCLNCHGHSALEATFAQITAIGLATEERGISVAWDALKPETKYLLQVAFANKDRSWVFHNRGYDEVVLESNGFPIAGRIDCTLYMHHNVFPGLPHKLQRVGSQFMLLRPWKSEYKDGIHSIEELLRYNCLMAGVPVILADGSTRPIEDLVNQKYAGEVLSWNCATNQIEPKRVVNWLRKRVVNQLWWQIRTEVDDGSRTRGLIVTPEHEVFTRRGSIRADTVVVGDEIATEEVLFTQQQQQAIVGTLLGDSVLDVSRVFRQQGNMGEAKTASLHGGHAIPSGLTQFKISMLGKNVYPGVISVGGPKVICGTATTAADFQKFHSAKLRQLRVLGDLVYDENWKRRITTAALDFMGPVGLAWWFMDDGGKESGGRCITIATHGFPREDVERAAQWLTARFGSVSVRKNNSLGFSAAATRTFATTISPFLPEVARYKLPANSVVVPFQSIASNQSEPYYVCITSSAAYIPKQETAGQRLQAEWQYCLTVEDNSNFFTLFGLVANCRDTLVTARLKKPLEALIIKRDATKTYEMDMRKCAAAKDMQITGVPVNLERNQTFREYFEPKVEKAKAALMARIQDPIFKENFKQLITLEQAKVTRKADADQFGLRQAKRLTELDKKWAKLEGEGEELFNLNSTPQLVAYLKACGVNLTVLTKKGKLSTKKDVLEQLVAHPAVAELLEFRANQTLLNTFVLPIPTKIDLTGRIHPIWSPNKISGRWGSSPNWQNATKGKTVFKKFEAWLAQMRLWQQGGADPGIPNLRWQCVAPSGYTMVGSDFKQIDARVIALLTNDEWLCNAFNTGIDIHSYFAGEIFPEFLTLDGKDPTQAKRKKDLRDITKRAEYGYFYGAVIVTVWKSIMKEGYNVPISTINKLFKTFETKMPSVIRYYMNLLRATVESGKVSSFLLGRAQYFPLGDAASDPTVIKNFVCQAGAADVADTGIIAVHEILKQRGLGETILQGHDAGTWLVKENDAQEVKSIILEHMAQVHTLNGVTMRFDVDVDIGSDWAST